MVFQIYHSDQKIIDCTNIDIDGAYSITFTQTKNDISLKFIVVSAVQHERAPRTYSKKPTYFSDFSAIAAAAAATPTPGAHTTPTFTGGVNPVRNPMINPLIHNPMHYYSNFPLNHFKTFFPALFPPPSAFYPPTTSTVAPNIPPAFAPRNAVSRSPSPKLESTSGVSTGLSQEEEKIEADEEEKVMEVADEVKDEDKEINSSIQDDEKGNFSHFFYFCPF